MPPRIAALRIRAVAAVFCWLPLILDAAETGDLLFALPGVGLVSGILPVRWFPWLSPAQFLAAGATIHLLPRRHFAGGWLFYLAFALAQLLNLALWLRSRASGMAPTRPGEQSGPT